MQTHQLIKRGQSHKNFCEDATVLLQIDDYVAGAVFDGCTSAQNSHLASGIFAKAFAVGFQVTKLIGTEQEILNNLVIKQFDKIYKMSKLLDFEIIELQTTQLCFLANTKTNKASILALGDGFVVVDDDIYEFDQNNTPDYPAANIDFFDKAKLLQIYLNQQFWLNIDSFTNLALSSDGIATFFDDNMRSPKKLKSEILDYLLKDEFLIKNPAMLSRKVKILSKNNNLWHFDDLGIVRINIKTDKNAEIDKK